MNYGPLIFLAAFFAMASSWFGLVLTPQMQVGHLQQTNTVGTGATYPLARLGLARQGLEVYRANGCASCHSQQVRQTGTVCDVLLTDVGTNQAGVIAALLKINSVPTEAEAKEMLSRLPQPALRGKEAAVAETVAKALKAAGAKAEIWVVPVGPDIARGWGKRRSVANDFLYDSPVMLGSQRIGPDLANVGARLYDPNWQLAHLYAPQISVSGSTMPPFRFLFEQRRIERARSADALDLAGGLAPPVGYEIVPKPEAKALVAYLLSLRADAPLYAAPVTVSAPVEPANTNAPSPSGAASTNAAPANAPAK